MVIAEAFELELKPNQIALVEDVRQVVVKHLDQETCFD